MGLFDVFKKEKKQEQPVSITEEKKLKLSDGRQLRKNFYGSTPDRTILSIMGR